MAVKIKKRKKSSRFHGSQTHGRGAKERTRKSGNRGGTGMAGTGKRADQKKTLILAKYGKEYFGKDKALRRGKKKEIESVTLESIVDNINSLIKRGMAKENKGFYEIDFKKHKIIGNDKIGMKLKINALAASKGAQESVKKAGGEIVLSEPKKRELKKIEEREEQ